MVHILGPSCFMTVIFKQYEYGSFESNVFEKHSTEFCKAQIKAWNFVPTENDTYVSFWYICTIFRCYYQSPFSSP